MTGSAFFGYGSLVNTATHDYANPRQATLKGWRRVWQSTTLRDTAFLSVERAADQEIDGLVADVSPAQWTDLDAREAAYARVDVTAALGADQPTVIYRVNANLATATATNTPILLSYLDVVVQGYLHTFGPQGVARFFASTHGWDAPILDDRAAPRYPRRQTLTAQEIALVDACLATRMEVPK
ncbi:gamma-glutamylcyclotransferase family protein [Yoonia sp. R2331]|uniref:gamma-glutamylcyclotransferase family protein n=1 Tax=Yoonia sp. R2331 TaxID=3237238 RepID=UPI0034E587DA